MGMEFEVKKNDFPTDRPIAEKQGRVRGNKNIFKVGPIGSEKSTDFTFSYRKAQVTKFDLAVK